MKRRPPAGAPQWVPDLQQPPAGYVPEPAQPGGTSGLRKLVWVVGAVAFGLFLLWMGLIVAYVLG